MRRDRRLLYSYLADIALIGLGLVIFALFHHVIPQGGVRVDSHKPPAAQTPVYEAAEGPVNETAVSAPQEENVYAPGDFTPLFESAKASHAEIPDGEKRYVSDHAFIRIRTIERGGAVIHAADVYVRNIEDLQTAFARDTYGKGYRYPPLKLATEHGAVLAVSGDYYGARDKGLVVRNGEIYRTSAFKDVCVIYRDGTMETCGADSFDGKTAVEKGMWQGWSFGPALLDGQGKALKSFDSEVAGRNPRCGIGYYEPGHYIFVVVDGRNERSHGATLEEFAAIFEAFGCKAAYNLDGGDSACMIYGDSIISVPSGGGRSVTDIIFIAEEAE